jgi:hypothetical protein
LDIQSRLMLKEIRGDAALPAVALQFFVHQFIATFFVMFMTPFLVVFGFETLRLFGMRYPMSEMYWVSTETGFFPVQVLFALFLGWWLGRDLRRQVMIWTWVLPFLLLCYAVIAVPTVLPVAVPPAVQAGVGQSRLWHYFASGCRLEHRCIDQIVIVLPFYAAAAYSIGAFFAPKLPGHGRRAMVFRLWAGMTVGLIFLGGAAIVVAETFVTQNRLLLRQSLPDELWPWRWLLLPYVLLPAVVGAWIIDFSMRTQRAEPTTSAPSPNSW